MNISSTTTGRDSLTQMISRVIDRFATEFGQFLGELLDGQVGRSSQSAITAGDVPTFDNSGRGQYRQSLAGFDFTKLDNPGVSGGGTIKYTAARVFQNYPPQPESLPAVIADLRAQGINALQVSFDKIDFNDGFGPIDVIQGAYPGGGVAWQWLPQNA
jgi:hypothetical protein